MGRSDRKSITSASMSSVARRAAAAAARIAMIELPTIVRSRPGRRPAALPIGTRYASSGPGPRVLYSSLCSKISTGLGSSIAASNRPLASCGVDGCTTFKPGTWANQASRLWLCCAAAPVPEPPGRRTTIGTVALPPNMKWIFAAWLTICSIASVTKSENCSSSTGFIPVIAAPTAAPAIPSSLIGVSITRSGPNLWNRSPETPNAPPYPPTSSPNRKTRSSACIACARPSRIASAYDSSRVPASGATSSVGIDVASQLGRIRIGACLGEFQRIVDRPLRGLLDREQFGFGEAAMRDQLALEAANRILVAPGLDFLLAAIEVAIAFGVPAQPIGLAFEQGRAAAAAGELDRRPCRRDDGGQVVAVDGDSRHRVCRRPIGDVGHGHRARDIHRHPVLVVFANEHDRQPPDRRHIERLVEGALVGGAVAEKHHADAMLL